MAKPYTRDDPAGNDSNGNRSDADRLADPFATDDEHPGEAPAVPPDAVDDDEPARADRGSSTAGGWTDDGGWASDASI